MSVRFRRFKLIRARRDSAPVANHDVTGPHLFEVFELLTLVPLFVKG